MTVFRKTENFKQRKLLHPLNSNDDIEAVHRASLDLLENGILVKSEAAKEIFYSHGCRVGKKDGLVRIPSHIVEAAIQSAPGRFLMAGRIPEKDIFIHENQTFFSAISGATKYLDPEIHKQRLPTKKDLIDCAKLVDASDEIDIANRVMVPADVTMNVVALHQLEAVLCNTTKHVWCSSAQKEVIKTAIEMAAVVVGGMEALRKRPLISVLASPITPLTLADECCDTIIAGAQAGLPVGIAVSAIGGASAPVTPAGLLVVHNTEILMGVVLAQLTAQGAPVLYSNYSGHLDMQTGLMPYGSPSVARMGLAISQMAGYYGIPWYGLGFAGDAHMPDYQTALESSLTGISTALAGAQIVTGAGYTGSLLVFSPAKMLCDCQLIKMIKEVTTKIEITDDRLATDLIKTIGPGRDFLSSEHTLRYFREQNSYELIDHSPFEIWQKEGSHDMIQRASAKAVQIMAEYHPEPLGAKIELELNQIIDSAEKSV